MRRKSTSRKIALDTIPRSLKHEAEQDFHKSRSLNFRLRQKFLSSNLRQQQIISFSFKSTDFSEEAFIDKNDILYRSQYGFQDKHSTQHAILDIVNSIQRNMDNKLFTCGIFIDLKKAFDTVNHSICSTN